MCCMCNTISLFQQKLIQTTGIPSTSPGIKQSQTFKGKIINSIYHPYLISHSNHQTTYHTLISKNPIPSMGTKLLCTQPTISNLNVLANTKITQFWVSGSLLSGSFLILKLTVWWNSTRVRRELFEWHLCPFICGT